MLLLKYAQAHVILIAPADEPVVPINLTSAPGHALENRGTVLVLAGGLAIEDLPTAALLVSGPTAAAIRTMTGGHNSRSVDVVPDEGTTPYAVTGSSTEGGGAIADGAAETFS